MLEAIVDAKGVCLQLRRLACGASSHCCWLARSKAGPSISAKHAPSAGHDDDGWTRDEVHALRVAMKTHPNSLDKNERFRLIAADVGRSKKECYAKAKAIRAKAVARAKREAAHGDNPSAKSHARTAAAPKTSGRPATAPSAAHHAAKHGRRGPSSKRAAGASGSDALDALLGGGQGGGSSLGGLLGGAGFGSAAQNYQTSTMPFGTTLDVIPYVASDGYTVHLTVIPKITEFLGYEDAPFQNQVIAGVGNTVSQALQQPLALPSIRVRYITSSVHVWDGQTLVLGGLIAENVVKVKDKVPMLGDLPFLGRLFRSERSNTEKKNLMIFVSPRIIDPAGNPVHTEENWPYDPNTNPSQDPVLGNTARN